MEKIIEMTYANYKKHYADCKTVKGSYDERRKMIKVVIPEGRMKNSGVRGERFHSYELYLIDEKGKEGYCLYRAVCFENAVKQHLKWCKKNNWTPVYDESGEIKSGAIFL